MNGRVKYRLSVQGINQDKEIGSYRVVADSPDPGE
jgi:hypothetical protein